MNSNIQPALPVDAKKLSALAIASKASWGYTPTFTDLCREVLRVTPEEIEAQSCYVYVEDGGLIKGFYLLDDLGAECDLDMLFVTPDAIGTGIGKALMHHALSQAVVLGYQRMLVVSDPHALLFYEKCGGHVIGWEKSEVSDDRLLPKLEFILRA